MKLLFFFLLFSCCLTAQDSTALANINTIFADLPVTESYNTILIQSTNREDLHIENFTSVEKGSTPVYKKSKIVLTEYPLHKNDKCTDCYISSFAVGNERTLRLTLNFESMNQESYNELIKKILATLTPFVNSIEQNIGAGGNLDTWLLFHNNVITPRIQIAEPSKAFTCVIIDYISEQSELDTE